MALDISALSLRQVSELSGISYGQLGMMARGERSGSGLGERLQVLATVLGVAYEWLTTPDARHSKNGKGQHELERL